MSTNFFKNYQYRISFRRNRKIMRGYDILKTNNSIYLLDRINSELALSSIIDNNVTFSKLIFPSSFTNHELIARQYLTVILCGNKLNKKILYSIGNNNSSIIYPLPFKWLNLLKKNGINVSIIRSRLIFFIFIIRRFSYGSYLVLINLYQGIKNLISKKKQVENFNYFEGLSINNIPENNTGFDIISWYENIYKKKKSVSFYFHSVKNREKNFFINNKMISFKKSSVPELNNIYSFFSFLIWSFFTFFYCIVDLLFGNFTNSLFFLEGTKAKLFQLTENRYLAKEYLFNISGMTYRPLWTYIANEKGSDITLYFYSTNCEPLVINNKKLDISYLYKLMNWPKYLVWDKRQSDFIKEAIGNYQNIEVVGPIWFSSSNVKLPDIPKSSILVFDVQPVRDFYYQILGLNFDYYTADITNKFLDDIFEVFKSLNFTIVHKRKREIGKLAHYKYRNYIKDIKDNIKYISIDSNIAPQRIIPNSMLVISMPFTSTAIIAKCMQKTSIFYDPTGNVNKDNIASHGIQLISGKESLKSWVENHLSTTI
jgi:polysaccharide biosynthesis PFTS motif protein